MPKNKFLPETFICHKCGIEFNSSPGARWRKRKNPDKRTYCSRECQLSDYAGSGNPKWRGGRTINDGYVYIYKPEHPYAEHHGYVLEHRLVMESILGRYLTPKESVHHIDGNKANNAPENLMLMDNEGEHRKLHSKYRTRDSGRFDGHLDRVAAYI